MKRYIIGLIFFLFSLYIVHTQTVEFYMGQINQIVFTLTPCSRVKAISVIDFFIDSKPFYHFDIYQFDFDNVRRDARILTGEMSDFILIYNGYSYGTINYGIYRVNCIMYCNSNTGQYSLLQFADFNLAGGVVSQDLRKIFERSVSQVDDK